MKRLLKRKVEKSYLLVVGVVSVFLVVGYFSYAYFTVQTEKANVISIKAGLLSLVSYEDQLDTYPDGNLESVIITVTNTYPIDIKFNMYARSPDSGVQFFYDTEGGYSAVPPKSGMVLAKGETRSFKIVGYSSDHGIHTTDIRFNVGLSTAPLSWPSNATEIPQISGAEKLLAKFLNNKTYENSSETEKKNMYAFTHTAGAQQSGWTAEELKDYRYIGKDPNNYVTFNGETAGWRIIGVFTVEDGYGKKEKRIKLIRKDPLQTSDGGNLINWDNKPSGTGSSESSDGSNDWTDARLMMLLNPGYEENTLASGGKGSIYWNQESGQCPYGKSNETTACDFRTTGLNEEARKMIGDTKWYLGGSNNYSDVTTEMFYESERGKETCTTTGNCQKTRPVSWVGKVGLIYPFDYGYATGGGSTISMENCLAKELYSWRDDTGYNDCYTNDWLYDSSNYQLTITPYAGTAISVFSGYITGYVDYCSISNLGRSVMPAVYLKSSVILSKGTGTSSNPFVFK